MSFFIFILFWLVAFTAEAKTIYMLGQSPQFLEQDYDEKVKTIEPGDTLVFENEHEIKTAADMVRFTIGLFSPKKTTSFKVGKKLGVGGTTIIYELLGFPERVLRIPKSDKITRKGVHYIRYINFTIDGFEPLRESAIALPTIFESSPLRFVVVERFNSKLTLELFMLYPNTFSSEEAEKMLSELKVFAWSTREFRRIGDLNPSQILYDYDTHRWVLIDWTDFHYTRAQNTKFNSAFTDDDWYKSLNKIKEIAEKQRDSSSILEWIKKIQILLEKSADHPPEMNHDSSSTSGTCGRTLKKIQ
jgi:predicted CopG family antitoxin